VPRPATTVVSLALALSAFAPARAQPEPAQAPPSPPSQSLGLSTARFWAGPAPAPDSVVLSHAPGPDAVAAPDTFPLRPVFTTDGGRHTATVPIAERAGLYGLVDTPGPFLRNNTVAHPAGLRTIILAIDPGGATTTIIADTASPLEVSFGDNVRLTGDADFPVIISLAESPLDAAITLSNLTGRLEMPPRWALGPQLWCGTGMAPAGAPPGGSLWITPARLSPVSAPDLATRTGILLPPALTAQLDERWPETAAANRRNGITGVTLCFRGDADPLAARAALKQSRLALAPNEDGPRPYVQATGAPLTIQSLGGALLFGSTPRSSIAGALSAALCGQSLLGFGHVCRENPETLLLGLAAMPLAALPADIDPNTRDTARAALGIRHRLTPYLYSLAFNAFFLGEPIIRPVLFADPRDPTLRAVDDSYLLGPDLLVTAAGRGPPASMAAWPVLDFGDEKLLPSFRVRPGAILPTLPDSAPTDPGQQIAALTLIIAPDGSGSARGQLYEDDGDGYAFFRNQARRTGYKCDLSGDAYFLRLAFLDGAWPLIERPVHVRILTAAGPLEADGTERGTIRIPVPGAP
jgi:hypothetical protein